MPVFCICPGSENFFRQSSDLLTERSYTESKREVGAILVSKYQFPCWIEAYSQLNSVQKEEIKSRYAHTFPIKMCKCIIYLWQMGEKQVPVIASVRGIIPPEAVANTRCFRGSLEKHVIRELT